LIRRKMIEEIDQDKLFWKTGDQKVAIEGLKLSRSTGRWVSNAKDWPEFIGR